MWLDVQSSHRDRRIASHSVVFLTLMVDGHNSRSMDDASGMDDWHDGPDNGGSDDGVMDQGGSHDVLNDGSMDHVAE